MEQKYKNLKIAEKGAFISLIAYIIITILKVGVGYFYNSKAVFADGLHNSTDIISSLAVIIGLKFARKPADKTHQYGYFRSETIAALVASLIMISVGFDVLYNVVNQIMHQEAKIPDILSAIVSFSCSVALFILYKYNEKKARLISSSGLMATAKDNLSDSLVSFINGVGIIVSQYNLVIIDSLMALIVSFLILKTGYDIFIESVHHLLDGTNDEILVKISDNLSDITEIKNIKSLKSRYQGNNILVDLVIEVDGDLSLKQAHNISDEVEEKLKKELDIFYTMVHIEPYNS